MVAFSHRRPVHPRSPPPPCPQTAMLYRNQNIERNDTALHLGFPQYSNMKLASYIDRRILKAKKAFFSMAALGVPPFGLNPFVLTSLYKKYLYQLSCTGQNYGVYLLSHMLKKIDKIKRYVSEKN